MHFFGILICDIILYINMGGIMKQLSFVFAATAGIMLCASAADAATRYTGTTKRHEIYQNYEGCTYSGCEPAPAPVFVPPPPPPAPEPVRKAEPVKKSEPRKPNSLTLADPFFQPASGRVASVTDIGWAQNKYNFDIIYGSGPWGGINGGWKGSEFFVKEDLSVGITDEVSIVGTIKYSNATYQMTWPSPYATDRNKNSDIALWGFGLQWKFYEDSEWIANAGGFFTSSKDISNNFILAGKVGYKFTPDTTGYGFANLAYVNWNDSSYGNGIISDVGQVAYIAFERDVSSSFYLEGGAGVFHKLTDQWSLDLQGIFGNYAWHNQLSARAAVYWQPSDWFAFGIYGRASIWDSAGSADDIYIYSWCQPGTQCVVDNLANPLVTWDPLQAHCMGKVSLSNYQDMQLGVNAILYF